MAHDIVVRGATQQGMGTGFAFWPGSRLSCAPPRPSCWPRRPSAPRARHLCDAESDLASAVSLSRARRAGFLYVTDLPGSPDLYHTLPGYWARQAAAIAGRC
jgi:hypothetical protein